MNLINLMPHRQRRHQQRRRRFLVGLASSVAVALGLLLGSSLVLERLYAQQDGRNRLLQSETQALQAQEQQVRRLQAEIQLLLDRQATVQALQSQRNAPVALANELVRVVPAGLAVTALRQNDQRLAISGWATSTERVSDLMARLQHESSVLQAPELVEMRAAVPPGRPGAVPAALAAGVATDRLVEFTLTVQLTGGAGATRATP